MNPFARIAQMESSRIVGGRARTQAPLRAPVASCKLLICRTIRVLDRRSGEQRVMERVDQRVRRGDIAFQVRHDRRAFGDAAVRHREISRHGQRDLNHSVHVGQSRRSVEVNDGKRDGRKGHFAVANSKSAEFKSCHGSSPSFKAGLGRIPNEVVNSGSLAA